MGIARDALLPPYGSFHHTMISFSSLPECSGTIMVTPIAIAIISTGIHRNDNRQRKRSGVLLERDRHEREQHEADEIGDGPDHAIGRAVARDASLPTTTAFASPRKSTHGLRRN